MGTPMIQLDGLGLSVAPPPEPGQPVRAPSWNDVQCVLLEGGEGHWAWGPMRAGDANAKAAWMATLARADSKKAALPRLGAPFREAAACDAAWRCVGLMSLALAAGSGAALVDHAVPGGAQESFLWESVQAGGVQGALMIGRLLAALDAAGHGGAARAARDQFEDCAAGACAYAVEFARTSDQKAVLERAAPASGLAAKRRRL